MRQTERGQVFACELSLRQASSNGRMLAQAYREVFRRPGARRQPAEGGCYMHLLRQATPATTALIDTETAGFYGRPLFLVGLARWRRGDLVLTQYFAQDYAQEAALLAGLGEEVPGLELLVSFNGKAFDWPFIRDRMSYHRLKCEVGFAHLDLLHAARRRWGSRLPNCQLRTLERHLCGRWRGGDIPSHEIPQRYHEYVQRQDARLIAPVFHHNRLDLVTMVELLVALAGEDRGPGGNRI